MRGKRVYSGRGLLALAVPNSGPETRVGVTVSRQLKGAVDRNRARRRVREAARASLLVGDSGAEQRGIRYDVVLIARPARSEERRVGKGGRSRRWPCHEKKTC